MQAKSFFFVLLCLHVLGFLLGLIDTSRGSTVVSRVFGHKAPVVMVAGLKAIYTLENDEKHLIPDWDTFCSLGYDMSEVTYVTKDQMNEYTTGADVRAVRDEGARDNRVPCPCRSKSRHPYELHANITQRARNICIVKNAAMNTLFSRVYELDMLQKHLRIFLIDEVHMQYEELSRWKLYNESVRQHDLGLNRTDKFPHFTTLQAFTSEDQDQDQDQKTGIHTRASDAKSQSSAPTSPPTLQPRHGYDSDSDPYPSPYFSKGQKSPSAHKRRLRGQARAAQTSPTTSPIYSGNTQARRLEESSDGHTSCDVIIELVSDQYQLATHVCPGVCLPHPRVHANVDLLLPQPKHPESDLTCSLSLESVFATSATAATTTTATTATATATGQLAGKGHEGLSKQSRPASSGAADPPNPKEVAHARLAMILHSIARRKIEECSEKEYWLPYSKSRLREHTVSLGTHASGSSSGSSGGGGGDGGGGGGAVYFEDPPRRKVRGLIIWIGSVSRFSLARSQIEVLQSQANVPPDQRIIGWLATEEIYGCALGSTTCTSLTGAKSYYNYMPTSKLDVSPAGYNCAQRRPLRAIAHTLHLFDPQEFLIVLDDDTWININRLQLGSPLSSYISQYMASTPEVLGQLTMGKKITRKGFLYGGSGYIMGRAIIDRLTESKVRAPPDDEGSLQRDATSTFFLQMMMQVIENSKEVCPDCFLAEERSWYNSTMNYDRKTWGLKQYITLSGGTRLIDACMHIMSEEHTCYASDHAVTRCLVHGAYASIKNMQCFDKNAKVTAADGSAAQLGMCFGVDRCQPEQHLTCHRWMPDPADYGKAVANEWTESDD